MNELIAYKCFFIHETPQSSENEIYQKYKKYIIFADYKNYVPTCMKYLKMSEDARARIAEKAFCFFKDNEKIEDYMKSSIKFIH